MTMWLPHAGTVTRSFLTRQSMSVRLAALQRRSALMPAVQEEDDVLQGLQVGRGFGAARTGCCWRLFAADGVCCCWGLW